MNLDGLLFCVSFMVCILSRTLCQSRGDLVAEVKYIEEAVQIVNTIFHKYKQEVPPRKHYPNPVKLSVNLQVQYVTALDVVAQTLDSTADLEVASSGNGMCATERNRPGKTVGCHGIPLVVKEITVEQDKIWTPVLSIDNAVEAPMDILSPKFVIKSNGEIYMYKRLQMKTFCETNLTSTTEDCEIVLGSNLLNEKIIDFDMNHSSCGVSGSSHELQVTSGLDMKRSEERSMLKENATFPEYVCTLHIEQTGCCTGSSAAYLGSNTSGVDNLILSFNLVLLITIMLCLL